MASCIVKTPPSSDGPSGGITPFTRDSLFDFAVPPALSTLSSVVEPPPEHPASNAATANAAPALMIWVRIGM